jgi:thiazole synthase
VRVIVNGESRDLGTDCSVAQLLADLRLTAGRVAVEINEEVVPRDSYPGRQLASGDRIEIVHFVGGGCA